MFLSDLKKPKCPVVGDFSFLLLFLNLEQYQYFKKGAQNANSCSINFIKNFLSMLSMLKVEIQYN